LLAGDFNTLAPGELLDMEKLPLRYRLLALMLGGRVTFRAIQMMLDGGYIDAYRMGHADAGYTFPAWDPHVRIDYFFVPAEFAGRVASCKVVTDLTQPEKATDHLPLIAEINV
jgi:endonuclease/exonuclease/phosphatase family metal-dependent hydrolase